MAAEAVEASRSPSFRSTEDQPPSFDAAVIHPPDGGEYPPPSSPTPQSSLASSKAAARAPAEAKQAAEVENSKVVSWILRRRWRAEAVRKADVASRLVASALCLISFSVMAADKNRGWTTDAFNFYKEYR